jgi:protocatechuate 3,4-dioxygenase, alpha subunit
MSLLTTSSQTVGPYLKIGFGTMSSDTMAPPDVQGERIAIRGRLVDGDGVAVNDGAIEIWQANAQGRYASAEDARAIPIDPKFRGFGRALTGADGEFRFTTIKPGRVPGPGGVLQAPHLAVVIFMRGSLRHLLTRMYFPGDAANAEDPILRLVPFERRATLIAKQQAQGALEWNICMQGANETVFFDF